MNRKPWKFLLPLVVAAGCAVLLFFHDGAGEATAEPAASLRATSESASPLTAASSAAQPFQHPVTIHVPREIGTVDTGLRDINGQRLGVACGTCHEQHEARPFADTVAELKEFHQDMPFSHGDQVCGNCHSLEDRDRLRLANGDTIEFAEVVTLCSQCHGTQARNYRHGAHGGMSGYWDLTRGPRVRNSCVDCHNPHVPAYPRVQPVFRPADRFLTPKHGDPGGTAQAGPADTLDRDQIHASEGNAHAAR